MLFCNAKRASFSTHSYLYTIIVLNQLPHVGQDPVVGGRGLLRVEGGLKGGDSKSTYSVQVLLWSAHAVCYHLRQGSEKGS